MVLFQCCSFYMLLFHKLLFFKSAPSNDALSISCSFIRLKQLFVRNLCVRSKQRFLQNVIKTFCFLKNLTSMAWNGLKSAWLSGPGLSHAVGHFGLYNLTAWDLNAFIIVYTLKTGLMAHHEEIYKKVIRAVESGDILSLLFWLENIKIFNFYQV